MLHQVRFFLRKFHFTCELLCAYLALLGNHTANREEVGALGKGFFVGFFLWGEIPVKVMGLSDSF